MADKLIIDWKEYNLTVEKLALQIHSSGYQPNLLIGIARGGLPITDVLSRIFKLKTAYITVSSYHGAKVEDQQGDITFARHISTIAEKNDLPEGISCIINGDYTIGEMMTSDNRLPLISATGSTRMGRIVGSEVAKRLSKFEDFPST